MAATRTPLNRQQILGFWAAWGGWVLDGMDSVIYALVLAPAMKELLPLSGFSNDPASIAYAGSPLRFGRDTIQAAARVNGLDVYSNTVTLQWNTGINQAPVVSAGNTQSVELPRQAILTGTVADDGLPLAPGATTLAWSMVSGPASVVFDDATQAATAATFTVPGAYVLRLTASDGVASDRLSKLFTGGATTWSFAPNISLPIFTAGETQANLDLAKVQKNIQIAQYEKTIQTAFREVADALLPPRLDSAGIKNLPGERLVLEKLTAGIVDEVTGVVVLVVPTVGVTGSVSQLGE